MVVFDSGGEGGGTDLRESILEDWPRLLVYRLLLWWSEYGSLSSRVCFGYELLFSGDVADVFYILELTATLSDLPPF